MTGERNVCADDGKEVKTVTVTLDKDCDIKQASESNNTTTDTTKKQKTNKIPTRILTSISDKIISNLENGFER